MAEAPEELDETGIEQRIVQMLKDKGSPVKTHQLAKDLNVHKKTLNQVLYRMQKRSRVTLVAPATWCLAKDGTLDVAPGARTPPSQDLRRQHNALATPGRCGLLLSELQEKIYRFLENGGPHKALHIAQALGMKTEKEVNPHLYALKAKHLLDLDQRSHLWEIYRPEGSGGRNQCATIIYQQNPVNMINQSGPHSHISIENSADIQIGHGNVMVTQTACGVSGSAEPLQFPPMQGASVGALGAQDIRMDASVLRRVQLGHANEMSVHRTLAQDPVCSPFNGPSGSATTMNPEASFKIEMPQAESCSGEDVTQRVHITSCFVEDSVIGNCNRMTVSPEGAKGPGACKGHPEEWGEDTGSGSEATQSRGESRQHKSQDASNNDLSTFTGHLATMTLESWALNFAEEGC